MVVIRAGIHKRFVRIANKEAHDQTASSPDINPKLVLKKKISRQKKKHAKLPSRQRLKETQPLSHILIINACMLALCSYVDSFIIIIEFFYLSDFNHPRLVVLFDH